MNFQDLHKVENSIFYVDMAFKNSKKKGRDVFLQSNGERITRIKKAEVEKIKEFNKTIGTAFDNIIKKFPSVDNLPEFYMELIKVSVDAEYLKKSLGALDWAITQIRDQSRAYEVKLKKVDSENAVNIVMREFYGRASSIIRCIDKNLKFIEESRKIMRNFPSLKTDLFTVAITGFPNIGKSTLLAKLTPAKPEIKNYSFTTKSINQGYANFGYRKVQFVDTPGVLNRDKNNLIEEQAYLVLKYLVNVIIYVIDLTEPYDLKMQIALLKKLKEYDKTIVVYLSKGDIIDETIFLKAKKKYKAVTTVDEVNKRLEKELKAHYFE